MLVAVCSAKGSPGVTSTTLALTAAWPDFDARLLEADPAGGDLAFRCRHASGDEVATSPNLLGLATAVRGSSLEGMADPELLDRFCQPLASGVRLVPGLPSPAQARGLSGLWGQIAHAAGGSGSHVVADLGRLQRTEATMQLAAAATVIVVVCQPSLESVTHVQQLISDVAPALPDRAAGRAFVPAVMGPHRNGTDDTGDVDQIMGSLGGLPIAPAMPIAYDRRGLADLEAGANPKGRLARTPLMRSATSLVERLMHVRNGTSSPMAAMWEIGPSR